MKQPPNEIELIRKYNIPVPRYTSYPAVPFWNYNEFNPGEYFSRLHQQFVDQSGQVCLYIHLPYCEELCTYCACNKRITKNHQVEIPYLNAVLKEWNMLKAKLPEAITIKEIHLGGGTPTFFSPENLGLLLDGLLEGVRVADKHEFSVEVHPNYTRYEHLQTLREKGFNRISLGVQDFDPKVQFIIHRIQSFDTTKTTIDQARACGYHSVNTDLIYGLPLQTESSIRETFEKVALLRPDRIAFYSYAHVPWKSKGQRRYSDEDVPGPEQRFDMFRAGFNLLKEQGYESIGMDHFALPGDTLLTAYRSGDLHRNFMGYTTTNHPVLIGLGASSISDCGTAYVQNEKDTDLYIRKIEAGEHPFINGHLLTQRDRVVKATILDLMCRGNTSVNAAFYAEHQQYHLNTMLDTFEQDGLISRNGNYVQVNPGGRLLVRNIASSFDEYLMNDQQLFNRFSKAV